MIEGRSEREPPFLASSDWRELRKLQSRGVVVLVQGRYVSPPRNKVLLLSINTSWNLVNFRRHLIARFMNEGFDVVAVSPIDNYTDALKKLGVKHIPIKIDSKSLSPLKDLALLIKYARIIATIKPAAFLGWTIKPNIWGSLAARLFRVPVINNISGLGTAFIKHSLLTVLVRGLYRAALSRSAMIFFQNTHDRQLFLDHCIVKSRRTALLPGSGIDLAHFSPMSYDKVGGPLQFLMIGRILRDKGVEEFADAARIVRAKGENARFALLGFLDVNNHTAINRESVEGWEKEGVLTYLGSTDDVRQHIAEADVVVLPSYREGMPRSLLEAAAMGKPLIATNVPGCTEIAREHSNALLCKAQDASSLASAMLTMIGFTPQVRAQMGRRSRAIAEAEFDNKIVEQLYIDAVRSAVMKPAKRRMWAAGSQPRHHLGSG